MTTELRIRPVLPHQDECATAVLARAFRDNPLDIAVIGGSPAWRLQSVTWGMRASLQAARQAESSLLLGAFERDPAEQAPRGVLLAIPSSALPLPPPPLASHLRSTLGQGLRATRRWSAVFRELSRYQPGEPHWYLSLIGVERERRGSGIGASLLRHWLARVDRDRLPAYLETDRRENLPFYRRDGFEVFAELAVHGARIWCMRRPRATSKPE